MSRCYLYIEFAEMLGYPDLKDIAKETSSGAGAGLSWRRNYHGRAEKEGQALVRRRPWRAGGPSFS
jgi:hypothetical protein